MTQVFPNPSEGITNYLDQYSKVKDMSTLYKDWDHSKLLIFGILIMLIQSSKGTTNYWISILKLKHDNAQ